MITPPNTTHARAEPAPRGATLAAALRAYLKVSLAAMFQYRGEIILWAVWGLVYPAVAMAMWSAAVAGNPGRADIGGFGPREFAGYFLLTMVVGHLCTAWDIFEMGHLVRSGRMSPLLLRPILPLWRALSDNVAYKILTLAVLVPTWLVVAWVARPTIATSWTHVLMGVPVVVLAAALNFICGYTLALAAFWITKMDALAGLWFAGSLFLGGRLAPLSILPAPLQWAAAATPFKWIIWFPTVTWSGRLEPGNILWGMLWQLCWLIGAVITFKLIWRAAIRRYSAVGA